MRTVAIAAAAAAAIFMAGGAQAEEHVVHMLNKGEKGAMVFQPALVIAAPGDTVRFVPTDKSHNVESVKGMLPDGVEPFKSKINEEFVLEVGADGVYGVKCTPHYGMGMVALVVAGDQANAAEAKAVKHSGKAKAVFAGLFEAAGDR